MSIDRPNESSINYRRRWWATTIAIVILTTTALPFKCKHCEFALSSKGVKCITTITWLNERNSITWWEEQGVGMKATNCWAYQIEQIASHTHREWWKEPKEIESKWRLTPHDDDWIIERERSIDARRHICINFDDGPKKISSCIYFTFITTNHRDRDKEHSTDGPALSADA